MLILLPPSEGKSRGANTRTLNLDELSFAAALNTKRLEVLARCGTEILEEHVSAAIDIYSGVLYKALNYRSLPASAQRRADSQILISSALFGILRPLDLIPAYKLKIKSSDWSLVLPAALDSLERELIVDCRSSSYATSWRPDPAITVAVRVFQVKDGERSIITHMSKKYRGELARALLLAKTPKNADGLLAIAQKSFTTNLSEFDGIHPRQLDLLIPAERVITQQNQGFGPLGELESFFLAQA